MPIAEKVRNFNMNNMVGDVIAKGPASGASGSKVVRVSAETPEPKRPRFRGYKVVGVSLSV